jgi:transcriptional regulator with XRE-family HTH domain
MNFGEKLKQIRIEKNMTQPQLAEAIGIEQSYLSKLENDKSVPSAEMFQSIIKALEMDAKDFLKDIDKEILNGVLKHIPEVSNFNSVTVITRVHNVKKWLIGSAAACAFGFALMLAANDGILFSNNLYKYESPGVILNGESEDIFKQYRTIQAMKEDAKIITREEFSKLLSEFEATRVRPVTLEIGENRGTVFFQPAENGRRKFELIHTQYMHSTGNKLLQFLGALLMFCGVAGFFIEWRLRKLQVH